MNDLQNLSDLLENKKPVVAMVAPSFPVMYTAEEITSRLRQIGFKAVVEVSVGAGMTNRELVAYLQSSPDVRCITSPCPSFVRIVRTKHPEFEKYLAFQADSPMIATARLVKKFYPEATPVFVGPCVAKKKEAEEDYPDLGMLVITYKEFDKLFSSVSHLSSDQVASGFDWIEVPTRIYPTDGGLTDTSGARTILKDEEIRVVSGWKECENVLEEFAHDTRIRLVDVLFCEGGCIMGPGVDSTLSLEERKAKIMDYVTA